MQKKMDLKQSHNEIPESDEYIFKEIFKEIFKVVENQYLDHGFKSTLKKVLQGTGLVLSLPAGVPFMLIAQGFANNNVIYGYTLAGGTLICYANVCAWSYISLFEKLFEDSEASRSLLEKSGNWKIAKSILSAIMAISSAAPSMYLAYSYNNKEILWPVINLLSSFGLRFYGFLTLIDKIELFKVTDLQLCLNTPENELRKTRFHLIQEFESHSNSIRYLNALNDDLLSRNETLFTNNMETIVRDTILSYQRNRNESFIIPLSRFFVQFAGGLLPASQIALNSIMSFKASKIIYDNPFFGIGFCIITVMPEAVLQIISGRATLGHLYDLIIGLFNTSDIGRSSLYYSPILSAIFSVFVVLVSAFSYGAGAHAINDNFSSQESKALLPLFISADTLFHLYVLSVNSSRLIRAFAHILGDENKKNALKKSDLMNSMSTLFTHLPDNKLNPLVNCSLEDKNHEIKADENEKIYLKNRNVFYKATKKYENIDEDLEIEESYDKSKRCCALF